MGCFSALKPASYTKPLDHGGVGREGQPGCTSENRKPSNVTLDGSLEIPGIRERMAAMGHYVMESEVKAGVPENDGDEGSRNKLRQCIGVRLSMSALEAENDVYSSGVHEALLQLGHAAGMQGKRCEDGIKLLLTGIATLQDSETNLLARQDIMRDEITQLVAMVRALRKQLKEGAAQEQAAVVVATAQASRGGCEAGVDQSSCKDTSVGQDGALIDLATPRGPLNREATHDEGDDAGVNRRSKSVLKGDNGCQEHHGRQWLSGAA